MIGTRGCSVGVDIGGTFTDVAVTDRDGTLHVGKVPTTPEDPRAAVVVGIRQVLERARLDPATVSRVVHGTTLATNVLLERRGGPVALVATDGFGDLVRLGREARVEDDRYDLLYTPTPPLVDPRRTFEVAERISARGEVLVALTDAAVTDVTQRVAAAEPTGVAVCFLHSYAYPAHEQAVAAALRASLPGVYVAASSEVWPELREYERAMTTVASALVGPVMAGYLSGLEAALTEIGVRCPVEVMESSGGVMSAARAAQRPVGTVESGGAAGVIAAGLLGRALGVKDVISFDMGGTTAKTGIVRDTRPTITHRFQIGGKGSFGGARPGTGLPVKIPVVDLAEVGAGGGSIAWVDRGGVLRVGPRSAGAVPGPACYERGGTEPTVTDANLVLGYLDPTAGLAGGVALSRDRAARAVAEQVGAPLGLDAPEAASAIHEVVNVNMAAAIRMVTVQRGIDPRGFTLVGFGGAGPLHVARLAEMFGIRQVVVPWGAGVASAVGLVGSEPTVEVVQTRLLDLTSTPSGTIGALFAELEARARAELAVGPDAVVTVHRSADLRYRGQAHELTVAVPDQAVAGGAEVLAACFRDGYRHAYGIQSDAPAELVSARVRLVQALDQPDRPQADAVDTGVPTPMGERDVWLPPTGFIPVPVFAWDALPVGSTLPGPAVIASPDTTLLVPPDARAAVDGWRNAVLTLPPPRPDHASPRDATAQNP